MIGTVFFIALMRLWNNKQELLLAIVVPIMFFSIFALIFSRGMGSGTAAIRIVIVDDDKSPLTEEIVHQLKEQPAIQVDANMLHTDEQWPLEKLAGAVIRDTGSDVVLHLPLGIEQGLQTQTEVAIRLLSEGTNPVGRQIVSNTLSQIVALALARSEQPDRMISYGRPPSPAAPEQLSRLPLIEPNLEQVSAPAKPDHSSRRNAHEWVSIEATDIFAADKHNPKIAMYAAGIAVMFLLFSATGAGGSLLEEYEAGTLDRLLSSRLTVTQLLAGKWLYITCLGCVQLTVMFLWAQVAFGVDLLGHIPGFAVMTLCTAAATASLAICLAVFCRSRAQLNGVSIVLILSMSALGGSMVPRYIMSEEMRRWGQLTFNAWALDGFKKVFWYELPVVSLGLEIMVLLVITVLLAFIARLSAARWAAN